MLVNNIKNKEIEEIYNFQYSLQKIYKVILNIKVKDKVRLYAIEKLINYINKTIQILNSNWSESILLIGYLKVFYNCVYIIYFIPCIIVW